MAITVYNSKNEKISLSDTDHIATGGEGSIYLKHNLIYKIYLPETLSKSSSIIKGLDFFKKIKHPSIATPTDLVFNKGGDFQGVVMPVAKGDPICKAFTTTWQKANNFSIDEVSELVRKMQEVVRFVHSHNALIVDGNELNWLNDRAQPTLIDTDSWQFEGHPATAIMPSIKDPQCLNFSQDSDWFSWAIVTFQLWTGIHPYKGTHPNYKPGQFLERMKNKISVFNPSVTLPAAARPMANIPEKLKNWYHEVFETSMRSPPPLSIGEVNPLSLKTKTVYASNATVNLTKVFSSQAEVLFFQNGYAVLKNKDHFVLDLSTGKELSWVPSKIAEKIVKNTAAIVKFANTTICISLEDGKVAVLCPDFSANSLMLSNASKVWTYDNRVYLVNDTESSVPEIEIDILGSKVYLSVKHKWSILPRSSIFKEGAIVQDVLGNPFLGIFTERGFLQMKAPALKGWAVVDVRKMSEDTLTVYALNKQKGQKSLLTFKANSQEFALINETEHDLDLNTALLKSGVFVIQKEAQLQLSKGLNIKVVNFDLKDLTLATNGPSLYAYSNHDIYKMALT